MDDGTPLITTVIPTFRRPRLLKRAVESVLAQEGPSLKVCVCDNASGDETEDVVAALMREDDRVFYHRHPKNIGGLANFEFGVAQVQTRFFSILSDDDYLLPDFYRRAIAGLERHPAALFWAGMTLEVDEKGTIWNVRTGDWPREGVFSPPEGFMRMAGGSAPFWTGILFRNEVQAAVGSFDPEVLGPSDLEYILRIAAEHPFVLEKHPSAVFMLNSQSFSATQPISAFWPGWKRMFEKFAANDRINPVFRHEALAELRSHARRMLFRRGANALAAARYEFAREAADALEQGFHSHSLATALRVLASACQHVPLMRDGYSRMYRAAESRIVASRQSLQVQYGHLLRTS